MLASFKAALFGVRSMYVSQLISDRTERGASMVEYALLVGLIAVVAVVAIAALGQGLTSFFNNANTCVGGMNSTSC
jgi:pilus assembly protein Flp/PilA